MDRGFLSKTGGGALALVIAVLGTGCSVAPGTEEEQSEEAEVAEPGSYTLDAETGETRASIRTEDGIVKMRSGVNVPVNLPRGFTRYPGSTIVTNTTVDGGQGDVALLIFETTDSPGDVLAYYRSQAESADIDIGFEMETEEVAMISGEGSDGTAFSLNASRNGDATSAQLSVGRGVR